MLRRLSLALLPLAAALVLTACSDDDFGSDSGTSSVLDLSASVQDLGASPDLATQDLAAGN